MVKRKAKLKNELKAKRLKAAFDSKKQAITVLVPGKFHFGVARIIDDKKIQVCAKFISPFDAAKFCNLINE